MREGGEGGRGEEGRRHRGETYSGGDEGEGKRKGGVGREGRREGREWEVEEGDRGGEDW